MLTQLLPADVTVSPPLLNVMPLAAASLADQTEVVDAALTANVWIWPAVVHAAAVIGVIEVQVVPSSDHCGVKACGPWLAAASDLVCIVISTTFNAFPAP